MTFPLAPEGPFAQPFGGRRFRLSIKQEMPDQEGFAQAILLVREFNPGRSQAQGACLARFMPAIAPNRRRELHLPPFHLSEPRDHRSPGADPRVEQADLQIFIRGVVGFVCIGIGHDKGGQTQDLGEHIIGQAAAQ